MSIPTFFSPFRIERVEGGYRARWLPRTARESLIPLDASPVMASRERVRHYMGHCYADIIEQGRERPTEAA